MEISNEDKGLLYAVLEINIHYYLVARRVV